MNFFRHPTTAGCSSVDDAVSSETDDPWGSSSSSFDHSVNKQNSSPTRQISPVRLHTQVGVPLNEINFSSSCDTRKKKHVVSQRGGGKQWDRMGHFSQGESLRLYLLIVNAGSIFQRKLRLLLITAFEERSARASQWRGPSLSSRCRSSRT